MKKKCKKCGQLVDIINLNSIKNIICVNCVQSEMEYNPPVVNSKIDNLDSDVDETNVKLTISKMEKLKVDALKAFRSKNVRLFNECQREYEKLRKNTIKYYKKISLKK